MHAESNSQCTLLPMMMQPMCISHTVSYTDLDNARIHWGLVQVCQALMQVSVVRTSLSHTANGTIPLSLIAWLLLWLFFCQLHTVAHIATYFTSSYVVITSRNVNGLFGLGGYRALPAILSLCRLLRYYCMAHLRPS